MCKEHVLIKGLIYLAYNTCVDLLWYYVSSHFVFYLFHDIDERIILASEFVLYLGCGCNISNAQGNRLLCTASLRHVVPLRNLLMEDEINTHETSLSVLLLFEECVDNALMFLKERLNCGRVLNLAFTK